MTHTNEEARVGKTRTSENAHVAASGAIVTPTQGNPQVIGRVQKNARERVRVALDAYNGRTYLDVRVIVQADDGSDKPTKAGITIRPDRIGDLRRLIEVAEAEAERLGLCDAR